MWRRDTALLWEACSCTSSALHWPLLWWSALSGTPNPLGPIPTWSQPPPTPGGDSRRRTGTTSCATAVFGDKRPFLLCRAVPSLSTRWLWQTRGLRACCCVFVEILYGHFSEAFPSYCLHGASQPSSCTPSPVSLPPPCCQSCPVHQHTFCPLPGRWGLAHWGGTLFRETPWETHASSEGEHAGHPAVLFPLWPCCTFHFWLGMGTRGNFLLLL